MTYASATGLNVEVVTAKVGVAVNVGVGVGVSEGVGVTVGVSVGVDVGPKVGVSVGVAVGPRVGVSVGVDVGVAVKEGPISVSMINCGALAPASRLARLSSVELALVSAKLNVPLPVI